MKTKLTRIALFLLAGLMAASMAFGMMACDKTDDPADTTPGTTADEPPNGTTADGEQTKAPEGGSNEGGYELNPHNKDTKAELTAFYNGNASDLTALAQAMIAKGSYISYNYQNRKSGDSFTYIVQSRVKPNGVWENSDEALATKILPQKLVGIVTCDPSVNANAVVFNPRMNATDKTVGLAYCADAEAKTAVETGLFHNGASLTLTELGGNWYYWEY